METNDAVLRTGSLLLTMTPEEVAATEAAIHALKDEAWAIPMVRKLNREGGCSKTNRSMMFEIRYARALHDAGISPTYEQATGVGNTSVDFAFNTTARWLVEAYSLAETEAAVAATRRRGRYFSRLLVPPLPTGVNEIPSSAEYKLRLDEHKKSVEGETLQTVERLLSKVSDGESPLKFPLPIANNYTMLTVDIRSLFSEHVDRADLDHIAYGANAVPIEYRLYWQSREGRLCPLRGIFDPANNLQKAKHFQERVHFLTILIEKRYGRTELSKIG
jgi:hypothetical protein